MSPPLRIYYQEGDGPLTLIDWPPAAGGQMVASFKAQGGEFTLTLQPARLPDDLGVSDGVRPARG